MNGHDRLAAGIIPMPQEIVRSLGSNDLEAGPRQRHDGRAAQAALSCIGGGDCHQLLDR
jgi:hypothetical protein